MMCDRIIMPDGTKIESIKDGDLCLCGSTQTEILTWIVQHAGDIEMNMKLEIVHDLFGWIANIVVEG